MNFNLIRATYAANGLLSDPKQHKNGEEKDGIVDTDIVRKVCL